MGGPIISIIQLSFLLIVLVSHQTHGEQCVSPKVTSDIYTTPETLLSTETVYIVEFTLDCSNKPKELNLYAKVDDSFIQVTKSLDNKRYQLSWTSSHSQAPVGLITVDVYDGETYGKVKQAVRSGETSEYEANFQLEFNHKGVWKGAWLKSELLALTVVGLVWFLAYRHKNYICS